MESKNDDLGFDDDDIDNFLKQQTNIEKESCMNVAAFVEEEVKGDDECKYIISLIIHQRSMTHIKQLLLCAHDSDKLI